jgi:MerR family transcriptional regulator, light-induced transcriptional regulator
MATVIGFGGRRRPRRNQSTERLTDSRGDKLGKILSLGVIPRLLIAHAKPIELPDPAHPLIRKEDIERLVPLAVHEPAHMLLEEVEAIMRRGVSAETVFVDLMAPVARQVGLAWEEDRLDFVQVSMALWRLQEVLRQIAANTTRAFEEDRPRSALFAPMPGDNHSFGTAMVHECFSIAGWDAELLIDPTLQTLTEAVARHRFDLVGLTLSCDCHNERVASLIRAVRSVSMNPHLCIMIGGRVPQEQPNFAALCGADGTATTAPAAVKAADRLVGMLRLAASA